MIGLALALVALLAGAYFWFNRAPAVSVRTMVVQETSTGGKRTLLNASGYVTARRQATVSSKVTGKVVEVMVEEGRAVKEGQVLARLDSSNVEKSLKLAEAQLESAQKSLEETRASLVQAEREWRRMEDLATNKIANQSDLDKAEADAKMYRARLERQIADVVVADRQVDTWKQQVDDNIIRAPFSGMVTTKNAQPGEMISPISAGSGFTRTGICTLVDMTSLEIEVDVNESYINRVEAGQQVQATLDSYPDWQIPCKVIAIIPTADRQKATVKVRVGFEKLDPRILPDMGVKVAFQGDGGSSDSGGGARMIRVPKQALLEREGRDIVWVVHEGKVERRAVTVGSKSADDVSIAAGLNGGERIVIEGGDNLSDGARVVEKKS
ncbi:MAG TPA: efflux RND transporter periplasmic adaptor subunit [Verrucomicrobiae bacterium]|nr:efflux RND transporter periplasmic adaptor subunit [Verrucomicrobiae bacterium]